MKPTEILKEEHRHIERMLTIMERAASRVEQGEKVPPEVFRDAIHFIRMFADGCHHQKEETLLFPALVRIGFSAESGPVGVMLSEHDLGRIEISGMHDALEKYSAGEPDAGMDLVAHAQNFAALLRNHIMKEDNILFVMADQRLSAQDQTRLSEGFAEAERTGEACIMKKDLVALLERMERESQSKEIKQ
jgi:hemerythrin-like domain-containing protein